MFESILLWTHLSKNAIIYLIVAFESNSNQPNEALRPDWAYSPSPMIWGVDPEYASFQRDMTSLLNNPPAHYGAVRPDTIAAIEKNVWGSDAHQKVKNAESLAAIDHSLYEGDAALKDIITHAKTGRAFPAEILQLIRQTNLSSAELARLTHPYGARDSYLQDMYGDVHDALKIAGASFSGEGLNSTRISFFDHDRSMDHGIITAKNDIASLDDIIVTERRSFAFQADFESFPEEIRKRMGQTAQLLDNIRSPRDLEDWKSVVFRDSGLLAHVRRSLGEAALPDHIIPVSTVIYAHRSR